MYIYNSRKWKRQYKRVPGRSGWCVYSSDLQIMLKSRLALDALVGIGLTREQANNWYTTYNDYFECAPIDAPQHEVSQYIVKNTLLPIYGSFQE